ncbi:hypothetical protein F4782DRAFT_536269 [Xylaria castorea]|nr:hypothetical protein F4782DRAFT_536269 [Xylaria castorea]
MSTIMKESQSWPIRVVVLMEHANDGTIRIELELKGLLSVIEKRRLDLLPTILPLFKETLQTLVDRSMTPRELLTSRFDCRSFGNSPQIRALFEDTGVWEDGNSVEAERLVRERRHAFVALASPTVIQDLLGSHIIYVIKDLLPNFEMANIPVLLSHMVRTPLEDRSESAMIALKTLGDDLGNSNIARDDRVKGDGNGNFNVYMLFTTTVVTDTFTFSHGTYSHRNKSTAGPPSLSAPPPKLSANGVGLTLMSLNLSPASLASKAIQLLPTEFVAQAYLRLYAGELEVFGTDAGTGAGNGPMEKPTLETSQIVLSVDLNAPKLEDLVQLRRYCKLRDGLNIVVTSQPSLSPPRLGLVDLLRWLSENPDGTGSVEVVATKVADCTGWNVTRVREAFTQKYRRHNSRDLVKALSDLDALDQLRAIMAIHRVRADESLMENQRKALFLVDVQIGPQLRTSCINLAILVVQLFVQRCLVRLENNVAKGNVTKED